MAALGAGSRSCTTEYHRGRSVGRRYAINHRRRRSPGNGCEVEMDRRLTCAAGRRGPWERSAKLHLILNRLCSETSPAGSQPASDCRRRDARVLSLISPVGRTGDYYT